MKLMWPFLLWVYKASVDFNIVSRNFNAAYVHFLQRWLFISQVSVFAGNLFLKTKARNPKSTCSIVGMCNSVL